MTTKRNTTKHTPGPWAAHDGWITADPKHGSGGEACVVAQIHSGPDCAPAEHANANARLIAAAPDLLAAGKAVAALWAKHGLGDDDAESEPVWDALRHAIGRAEGQ
jgi:hypothetical protein